MGNLPFPFRNPQKKGNHSCTGTLQQCPACKQHTSARFNKCVNPSCEKSVLPLYEIHYERADKTRDRSRLLFTLPRALEWSEVVAKNGVKILKFRQVYTVGGRSISL